MSDFIWTDELVMKIVGEAHRDGYHDKSANVYERVQKFKEEKTKRDWEIVKFISKKGDFWWDAIGNDTFRGCAYGSEFDLNSLLGNPPDGRASVANGEILIYSVKRISDGEVFSIGDELDEWGAIESFFIQSNQWLLAKCGENRVFIHDFQKVVKPKPLFVTEDGVEIFDSNVMVYSVCTKGLFEASEIKAHYAARRSMKNFWKFFSTKEKRDEYIFYNKPLLSLQDINYDMFTQYCNLDEAYAHIKQLAKEKLSI